MSLRTTVAFGVLRLAVRAGGRPTVAKLRRLSGPPARGNRRIADVEFHQERIGAIGLERVEPDRPVSGDLVFFPGGAYVAGTPRAVRPLLGPLCREAGVRGWAPAYQLAPEHPFPAALEDAVEAWIGLVRSGLDPATTLLGGESAGGGLALAVAVAVRDRGLPQPAGLVLLWPWTDLTLQSPSIVSNDGRDLLPRDLLALAVDAYCAGTDPADPQISPLFADLRALPPVFLQVGDRDLVRDDTTRLAGALAAAGVTCELNVWPGMPHGWAGAGEGLPEARRAVRQAALWVRRAVPPLA